MRRWSRKVSLCWRRRVGSMNRYTSRISSPTGSCDSHRRSACDTPWCARCRAAVGARAVPGRIDPRCVDARDGADEMRWRHRRGFRGSFFSRAGPLNDMAMDSKGRCYVGNFGLRDGRGTALEPTAIIRVDPDGRCASLLTISFFRTGWCYPQTSGPFTSLRPTVVASPLSRCGRDGNLGLGGPGRTSDHPAPRFDIPDATTHLSVLPDGLTLDCGGALWVADAKGHGIARVVEGGQQTDFVDTAFAQCLRRSSRAVPT